MMAVPDPDTVCLDPFFARPTVSIIANVVDPVTRQDFSRDPRHVARKAEAYLRESGIADICYVGPEPEFFIFDEVRYEQNQHKGTTRSIRSKVRGTRRASRSRTSVTNPASKAATFRSARPTLTTISAERWSTRCARSASLSKRTITKWPPRDRARSTCSSAAAEDGRSVHVVQVHLQERRAASRQDGHVHAQTDFRGQRQRHAHSHLSVEREHAALRGGWIRRPERAGPARGRRTAQARGRHSGLCGSHNELLPPSGAGL